MFSKLWNLLKKTLSFFFLAGGPRNNNHRLDGKLKNSFLYFLSFFYLYAFAIYVTVYNPFWCPVFWLTLMFSNRIFHSILFFRLLISYAWLLWLTNPIQLSSIFGDYQITSIFFGMYLLYCWTWFCLQMGYFTYATELDKKMFIFYFKGITRICLTLLFLWFFQTQI